LISIIIFSLIILASPILLIIFSNRPVLGIFIILLSIPFGGIEFDVLGKTPKLFYTNMFSLLLIGSFVIKYTLNAKLINGFFNDEFKLQRKKIYILTILYCILACISIFKAADFFRSSYLVITRIIIFLSFIIALKFAYKQNYRIDALKAVAFIGVFISVLYISSFWEVYDTSSFESMTSDITRKDNLANAGLLGVSNTIASFMAFTIPLTVALLTIRGRLAAKAFLPIISLGLQIITLIVTNSSTSVISLIAAITVVIVFFRLFRVKNSKQLFNALLMIFLLILVVYSIYSLTPEAIWSRYQSVFTEFYMIDHFIPKRAELLLSSWMAFKDNPLLGIGIGNVGLYDATFGTGAGSETHNLILQVLAEEGIVSAVIMGSILLILFKRLINLIKNNNATSQLWILVAFLSCFINANIEPAFLAPQFAPLFWISMAILVSGPTLHPKSYASQDYNDKSKHHHCFL